MNYGIIFSFGFVSGGSILMDDFFIKFGLNRVLPPFIFFRVY